MALPRAAGQRAIRQKAAAVGPATSRATPPPTNTRISVARRRANSTTVETTSVALRLKKPRPLWTSNTTLSARRAASR